MNSVLVVIDVQQDFLKDVRMNPPSTTLLPKIGALLGGFRAHSLPVAHIHYITEPDGRGYLSHHQKKGRPRCLRGSPEAVPDPHAAPASGEPVFAKHAYSAFDSESFERFLTESNADTLVLCGCYTHACVRQTALDGHTRGYRVVIAEEAVASTDPLHAEVTRGYLAERGVEFVSGPELFREIDASKAIETREAYEPARYSFAGPAEVDKAVRRAVEAQREWAAVPAEERLAVVENWVHLVLDRADRFFPLMISEVSKPIRACRMEMQLLGNSFRVLKEVVEGEPSERLCRRDSCQEAIARRRPRGVVGVISPWNNPVYLPACKIAAATALGNGVVWKPAPQCVNISMALQDTLVEAGFPEGLVNMVPGDKSTAQFLVAHPGISAVTLTGSTFTGRQVATTCGSLLKPLQAELGGNNAAVVLSPCDLKAAVQQIALSAFGYAGQACTATRRVIVDSDIKAAFLDQLRAAAAQLRTGDPGDERTVVGPVISRSHKERVERMIAEVAGTARVHTIPLPDGLPEGVCWMPMRIIEGLGPEDPLVQVETFAPVLVVQEADGIDAAIRLCNAVPQGLIGTIFCRNEAVLERFRDGVSAGVVQLNLPTRNLHMESPFGGWKDSGLGPPEHGIWDLDFYTRWQAVNRKLPG